MPPGPGAVPAEALIVFLDPGRTVPAAACRASTGFRPQGARLSRDQVAR
jgi:hypothetical protein